MKTLEVVFEKRGEDLEELTIFKALFWAAGFGAHGAVKFLLSKGADLTYQYKTSPEASYGHDIITTIANSRKCDNNLKTHIVESLLGNLLQRADMTILQKEEFIQEATLNIKRIPGAIASSREIIPFSDGTLYFDPKTLALRNILRVLQEYKEKFLPALMKKI